MNTILITTISITIIGILVAAGLVYVGNKFHVEVDARESAVREMASLVAAKFADGMVVTKDGVSVPLGIDRATEEVIWAHFEVTVNMKEPVPAPDKPAKKNKMF